MLITRTGGTGKDTRNINGVPSGTPAAITSITTTQITFTITPSSGGVTNSLTWQNIQVRPSAGGPVASGNITTSGTATMSGVTAGVTNFGTLTEVAGAKTKLVVTLPGQTFTSGSGNSGTVTAQNAGTQFTIVIISATDQYFNPILSYNGTKTINYSGPGGSPSYITNVNFTNGQSTTTLSTTLYKAETTTVTVNDGTTTGPASSSLTVNPGSVTKLQLLSPGETAAPGTATGKTGSLTAATAGSQFTITVNAVDANWNLIATAAQTVSITSTDANAILPSNAALVAGTQTFNVTLNTAGTATLTAAAGGLTSNTSPLMTVNTGAFTKLQILMPGETAAPGTTNGKTGSPSDRTAGTSFNVTVNAVDNKWNVVNTVVDVVGLTSTDANATLPSNTVLFGGTKDLSVTFKTVGSATITASDITDGAKSTSTSPNTNIVPGAFTKLQLLVPGETAAPGTPSGKTGSPTARVEGVQFNVTVRAVDANWNIISSVGDVVGITTSAGTASLPSNTALSSGTQTLLFTFTAPGTATITASDISDGAKSSNTSPTITINSAENPVITPATGGSAISADNTGGIFVALTGPSYQEGASGQIGLGTIILNAPSGFEFATTPQPSFTITNTGSGGTDISIAFASVTASQITFNVTGASTNGAKDLITWQGVKVRPTAGTPLVTQNMTLSGTASLNGVTPGVTNFGSLTVVMGAVSRIVVTLPGETFTAGSGNSGTVTQQTAGTSFNITKLTATDQFFNIITSYSGAKTISYSGPGGVPSYTTAVSFTNGQSTTVLTTNLKKAETTTITAGDGSVSGPASSSLTVAHNVFAKMQLLVPGETAAPGTASGKTGTPTAHTAGSSFSITVNAVDANWNFVSTAPTNQISISSSDAGANLPSFNNLSGGTQTFTITLNTVGNQTITATNNTDGSKTANTSPSIPVNSASYTKLILLLPGETATPGTSPGKTGTPTAQTAGTSFNVTVNAVDNTWNLVNTVTDNIGITSTDGYATLPANTPLVAGTKTLSVTMKATGAGTITASDVDDGGKTPSSSNVTVNAGAFTKLQILVPGETAAPGSTTGKTGSPSAVSQGTSINVTVRSVDANWNLVNSSDGIVISSSDGAATLPANNNLSSGSQTFSVILNTPGTKTITATDNTDGGKTANTSAGITVISTTPISSTTTGGNWSATSTWVGGVVPGDFANVIIATTTGNAVIVDQNTAAISTLQINADAMIQGGGAYTLTLGKNSGTDLLNNGILNAGSMKVRLGNNSQWDGTGTFNLNTIDLNSYTLTLAFSSPNTVSLSAAGDPILNPGTIVPGTNSTIRYNGTSAQQTPPNTANINFNNLQITNTTGVTLKTNLTAANLTGNLTISSGGVLNTSNGTEAYNIAGNVSASLVLGANSKLVLGSTAASTVTAFPTGFTSYAFDPTSIVEFNNNSTSTQNVPLTYNYGTIQFTGTGAKSLSTGTVSIAGNWINTTGVSASNASVIFNGTTAQSIGGTDVTTFANVTISNTSATVTANTNFNVTGALTVSANSTLALAAGVVINSSSAQGTLAGSGTIRVTKINPSGDLLSQYKFSTYNLSGLVSEYAGLGAQTINPFTYGGLTTSGSGTKSLQGNITVNNSVTIGSGTTLSTSASNYNISVGSSWTNNGGTFNAGTGTATVDFNGTGAQTIGGTSSTAFNNLTLSNTGTKTLVNSVTLTGDLSISGSVFDLGTYTANRTSAGGTLTVANGSTLKIGGTNSLPTNYSTHTFGPTSTIEYNGTTQIIGTLGTNENYGNLLISTSGAKTLGGIINVAGNLTVSAGTLDLSTFTAAHTGAGTNTLEVDNGATLKIGGTNTSLPANYSAHLIGPTSTIEYNGTNQIVGALLSSQNYGDLLISASGTKTLGGIINVAGNLIVSAGTLDLGTNTANCIGASKTLSVSTGASLVLGGSSGGVGNNSNFPSGFAFNTLNGTVEFNGTGAQTIPVFTYTNLTFTNGEIGGIKTIGSSMTVNGKIIVNDGAQLDIIGGMSTVLTVNGDFENSGVLNVGGQIVGQ